MPGGIEHCADLVLGALFTHLAPTAIALPSYFCLADLVLIMQCVYYNSRNKRRAARKAAAAEASEQSPLLGRRDEAESPRHDRIDHNGAAQEYVEAVATNENDVDDGMNGWVNNTLSLIAVHVVGAVAWFISYKAGAWDAAEPTPDGSDTANDPLEMTGLILGYLSAVAYLW